MWILWGVPQALWVLFISDAALYSESKAAITVNISVVMQLYTHNFLCKTESIVQVCKLNGHQWQSDLHDAVMELSDFCVSVFLVLTSGAANAHIKMWIKIIIFFHDVFIYSGLKLYVQVCKSVAQCIKMLQISCGTCFESICNGAACHAVQEKGTMQASCLSLICCIVKIRDI